MTCALVSIVQMTVKDKVWVLQHLHVCVQWSHIYCWIHVMFVTEMKEDIDDSKQLIECFCEMKNNVYWNRLEIWILRTAAVWYLVINLQRLHHSVLITSVPLLDLNLLKHVWFHAGCIMSHNCIVLLMKDHLQHHKTVSCSIKRYQLSSSLNNPWINSICAIS